LHFAQSLSLWLYSLTVRIENGQRNVIIDPILVGGMCQKECGMWMIRRKFCDLDEPIPSDNLTMAEKANKTSAYPA